MVAGRNGSCRNARLGAARSHFALGLGLIFFAPAPVHGNTLEAPYHTGTTLICSDCHEFSRESPAAGSAHLRIQDVNRLCLSCHDGVSGVPDVAGSDINGSRGRSAGFFDLSAPARGRGHSLGGELTCISCHDPHGNGTPRNLRLPSDPDHAASLGLFVRQESRGLERYQPQNVAYGTLDNDMEREVSALCLECHRDVGGPAADRIGPAGGHFVHPSYDSRGGSINRISQGTAQHTSDPAFWNQGAGAEFELLGRLPFLSIGAADFASASQVDAGRNAVFCLSCHMAHASGKNYALRWNQIGREGTAGCNQCHDIGHQKGGEQMARLLR
jgi:hypothetical protein